MSDMATGSEVEESEIEQATWGWSAQAEVDGTVIICRGAPRPRLGAGSRQVPS
jgi:hypothetical protein